MDNGSITFRVARTLAAGAVAALRWLLVLVVVVLIGLPLARIAVGWYVRGRLDTSPPPATTPAGAMSGLAVGSASPREAANVRSAAAGLRYRLDPHAVTVVLMDRDPLDSGAQGEYLPYLGVIRLQRSLVDAGGIPLSWAVAHEIGHYVDERFMNDRSRTQFRKLRRIPATLSWQSPGTSWNDRPDEDFAEVFAALAVPEAITPPATAYGRVRDAAAIESVMHGVGVSFGANPPPTGWRDLVIREYAFLRDTVTDPQISDTLLALLAVYLALGAVPAMLDAWESNADSEGVPREVPLDRRMARVLNTPRLVPHTSRRRYVTNTGPHHGGRR